MPCLVGFLANEVLLFSQSARSESKCTTQVDGRLRDVQRSSPVHESGHGQRHSTPACKHLADLNPHVEVTFFLIWMCILRTKCWAILSARQRLHGACGYRLRGSWLGAAVFVAGASHTCAHMRRSDLPASDTSSTQVLLHRACSRGRSKSSEYLGNLWQSVCCGTLCASAAAGVRVVSMVAISDNTSH